MHRSPSGLVEEQQFQAQSDSNLFATFSFPLLLFGCFCYAKRTKKKHMKELWLYRQSKSPNQVKAMVPTTNFFLHIKTIVNQRKQCLGKLKFVY